MDADREQTAPDTGPMAAVLVLAKVPEPGRVKTRLIGRFSAEQAAAIHAAMLQCTLVRLTETFGSRARCLLALDDVRGSARPDLLPAGRWQRLNQGEGDLGQRMLRLWRRAGGGPVLFFGADSPDVPRAELEAIPAGLRRADVAIGPASDGGYWCLAARKLDRRLLTRVDWGTANVYHQTCAAAGRAGLSWMNLRRWPDVDEPDDLERLRLRLVRASEPALIRLRDRLDVIREA